MTTTTPTAVTNFQSVNTTARLGNSVDSIKLSDGTYIVVYAIDDGNGGSTVVAQQIDEIGNTIGGEMTLGSSASGSGIDFSVTAFENNQIVLAFEDDGAIQIDAFTIVDGVATADPAVSQTITGTGGSILREPRLTGDTLADLKLHYTETTGTTVVAVEQRDVVNGAFTNTTDLFSSPGNANAELVSAQLANGNTVVVVDDDGDGGAANWDVQIVAPDGTQVSQFTHLSDGGSRMSDPAVAGLANGGFVIAFRDADNDDDLYMRIYDDTGNLVVNLLGFDETGDASDSSLNPEVLALSDGSFVAFYFDDRDDQLRMKRFDENGVEIGNEITIDTGNNFDGISATLLDDGLLAITVTDANGAIVTQTRAFESDRLFEGTDGDDTFTATSGDDTILGTLGDDTINGGDGDDFFSSGEGDDSYNGGAGTDTLSFADETEALFVDMLLGEVTLDDFEEAIESQFENFEIVIGTDFGDTINSDVGDTIFGGAGDDVLLAQVGPANLFGGTGNDRIATNSLQVASTEFSVFDGGEGIDTLDFGGDTFSTSTPVTVDLAAGSVTSAAHSVFISGFENVEGSNGADDISGDANDNQIFGFLGADTILGRDGNDSIFGGSGDDTLTGDDGDTFSVHLDNDDVISGGDGDDTVFGGNGVDSISGGEGEDSIQGGEGDDFIEGDAGNDIIIGNDGADLIFGGEGVDTIFAGNGDDSLSGDAGNDGIYAGAGDDTLFGGDGNDNAFGGDGDDVIDLGAGLNSASGGAGTDIITGGDDQDTISGDGGADTLFGGDGDDNLFGGEGQDVVFGGLGDDIIGEETFGGSNGADILNGDEGNDILIGGNGTDILNGGADNDTLFGGSDADTLTGGDGDDTIAGGTGDDMIIAGLGADSLFGGNGIDTVDYSASGASIEVELESSAEDTGSGIGGFAQGDTFSLIENVIGTDFNDQITGNVFDNVFT
ncbi:MAG: calcium-binding protein, partial [Octadecabacter sp.]